MALETTVQPKVLVRYGHQAGDILKLEIHTGERVTRFPPEGPPLIQEVEQVVSTAQAIAEVGPTTMVLENSLRSATFRRDDQIWDIPLLSAEDTSVKMLRSGADIGVQPQDPLAPFVFPSEPIGAGDSWDAIATLSLKHCEAVPVTIRCTVVETEQPDLLVVDMRSEEMKFGEITAQVSGRLEFSTVFGCLLLGVLGNVQKGQEGPHKVEWQQWLMMLLTDRIGVEEFAVEH